ncbi:hypothetical protein DOI34_26765 [Salmonella enterica subsp. enterica serovar Virchow]|nr:hypothetical protein [Salmonella enterica subsp. enterica serovar Virchow]
MWRINTWELPADERVREHNLRAYAPNLPALRKQAQRDLAAAIRARVEPAGYVEQEKDVWVRSNAACKTYVQIQKGRDGVSCSINIGREDPLEATVPSYKNGSAWRLAHFEDTSEKFNRVEAHYYYDLATDHDFLPYLMQLMDERVLHFLMCSHLGVGLTERPPRG